MKIDYQMRDDVLLLLIEKMSVKDTLIQSEKNFDGEMISIIYAKQPIGNHFQIFPKNTPMENSYNEPEQDIDTSTIKYWQRVKIKEWFYEWLYGYVIRKNNYIHTSVRWNISNDDFGVALKWWYGICNEETFIVYLPEENLILIESKDD